jgi:hypothetical protein
MPKCGLLVGSLALSLAEVDSARHKADATSAIHVVEKIGELLQERNMGTEELVNQLSEYASAAVTPGADGSFATSLKAVAQDLEGKIEKSITDGQTATQGKLNSLFQSLEAANIAAATAKKSAVDNDKSWFNCAADEQAKRQVAEHAEKSLADAQSTESQVCQRHQDNTGFKYDGEGKFTMDFACDHSVAGSCEAALKTWEAMSLEKMYADAEAHMEKEKGSHDTLKASCDAKKQARVEAKSTLDSAESAWSTKRAACAALNSQHQTSMCDFGAAAQSKCSAEAAYAKLVAATKKAKGDADSEVDRESEWLASGAAKCMVATAIQKGLNGAVAGADLDACAAQVNFGQDVGKLNTKQAEFDTVSKVNACADGPITFFNGETWNIPSGAKPPSSSYTKTAFTPQLDPTAGNFDFCSSAPAPPKEANPCDVDKASCECFAHRDPNFCNTCAVDCGPCRAFCGLAPKAATITKAPEGGRRDSWNNPSNWDGGKVPSGTMSASVAENLHVTVDSDATPAYTGELTLQAGSKLRLAWTSRNQGIARAVSDVSGIVMKSGSEILSNLPRNIDFPPITLNGDASVTMPSTGVHGRSFSFKTIDGAHKFSLISCHRCKYDFTAKSTFSEFVTNVIGTSELHAKAPGCFGPGDVSLNLGPTHGQVLKLFLDDSNAISSSATLSLTSKSSRFGQGKLEIVLAPGVTQVVANLVVDGRNAKRGSYRAGTRNLGGASVTFVGEGELVVKR